MVDSQHKQIKERMKTRSMKLWGIEDKRYVDPVIELLLDVFSYELSKVHQEIKLSDAKLLERIAKILVDKNWSLPTPSHALIQARPIEDIEEIDASTQLYFQRYTQEGIKDIFFTPIDKHKLINAKVYCSAYDQKLLLDKTTGFSVDSIENKRLKEYNLWVGIDIDTKLLNKLDELPLGILLKNSPLNMYLHALKFYDIDGNEIAIKPKSYKENTYREEHYYTMVMRYYQDYLYTLDVSNCNKEKQGLTATMKETFDAEEIKEYETELFWIRLEFPVAFTAEELSKIEVNLNTFPIVNRKAAYRQHQIRRNGKIISLTTNDTEHFLNIEHLIDNDGQKYTNALENDISDMSGAYSLYFGELEQFDSRNAKSVLNQVIQTVREEGSSFSAIGYDLLNAYLEDLNEKLNELEQKVNFRYKNVSDHNNKLYLLTVPYPSAETYECSYWTTTGSFANGIESGVVFSQYQSGVLQADSLRLLTDTVGGNVKNSQKEKINNLRYGLISKDRIVSNEDVKAFIKKEMGSTVAKVEVASGVSISTEPKQGLIRTIQVNITMDSSNLFNTENKDRLTHYLQRELEHRSVHQMPYRVQIL